MYMHSFFSQLWHSVIPRRAAIILAALLALAWSIPAFCGEIHDAVEQGDLAKVKALVEGNPELLSSEDNNGWTPLRSAASEGHKDVVELLLAHGADVNANGDGGWTPLQWAAYAGYKDVVELLRQYGGHE